MSANYDGVQQSLFASIIGNDEGQPVWTEEWVGMPEYLNSEAAGVRNHNELITALADMTRTAEVVLTTPHLQIEQRENARADMAESVRYCKQLMEQP